MYRRLLTLLVVSSLGAELLHAHKWPATYVVAKKDTLSVATTLVYFDTALARDSVRKARVADSCRTCKGSADTAKFATKSDSSRVSHISDTAKKSGRAAYADSARATWKADSAHVAWFAHAATYADSSRVTHQSDSSAYTDSSRASGLADSAKRSGTASTATKLATARTLSMTGDGTWSTSFDGSANATGPLHLVHLLASGSAGSASSVPTLIWDTTGRLTSVGSVTIAIPHTQISDWGTYINQPLLTTSSPTFAQITAGAAGAGSLNGVPSTAWFGRAADYTSYRGYLATASSLVINQPSWNNHVYIQTGGINAIDAVTAGGTAATTSVTINGLLVANNGISGNLTGTASNASNSTALGGVAADYFVQGTGYDGTSTYGVRTTWLNGAGTSTVLTQPLKSGFYDNYNSSGQTPNSNWAFLINSSHSNSKAGNEFQFQIAASFDNSLSSSFGGENYWMRVINSTGNGSWRTLLHSGNVGSYAIPLTGSSAITGSLVPQNASYYNLGTASLPWYSVHASAVYEAGIILSARYAPIATPNYFSTNTARTLSSQAGSIYVYTVSQTTTQTLQDGTIIGETITIKNAQNSSTLSISGNINAGSSVIPSLTTSILSWDGSKWY